MSPRRPRRRAPATTRTTDEHHRHRPRLHRHVRTRHGRRGGHAASSAATAAWLTSADSKVIGRNMIGGVAARPRRPRRSSARSSALERIDGADSLLDAGALPQLFAAFRVGLVYGVLVPLLLGIAVAVVPLQVGARSLAFPRLAAAGFWAWLGGLVLVIVVARRQRRARRRQRQDGRPVPRRPRPARRRPRRRRRCRVATTVLTTRAPGMRMRRVPFFTWSALVASIGLLLVLPVVLGVLIYLFVDHRNARALFGGNVGVGVVDRLRPHPAGDVPVRPPGRSASPPSWSRSTFRKRMPMRGVVYAGLALVGVAALSARHPAGVPRPAVVRQRPRPRRLRRQVRRPPAVRPVHAAADPRRADRARCRRPRSPSRRRLVGDAGPASRRRSCSPSSALGMVLVGMLGGALVPDHRPRAAGHRVRGGRRSSTSPTAACSAASAPSPGGCRSGPAAPSPTMPALGLALLGVAGHRARLAAVLRRRVRRSAGGLRHVRLRAARRRCGTSLVTVGHALMVLTSCWRSPASSLRPARRGDAASATTRGAARRWSGRRRRRPRSTTSPRCRP